MQLIGIILIIIVIGLYTLWLCYTLSQRGIAGRIESGVQVFNIKVLGVYSPAVIKAKLGRPLRINFTRREDSECSRFVNFPEFKIRRELPRGQTVSIELTPDRPGQFSFSCDMSMYQGKLIVE